MSEFIWRSVVLGVAATALLDVWAMFLQRAFGIAPPNWAMVGRWVGHLPQGRLVHDDIGQAEPVANELAIGWVFHYAVGIVFAAALLAVWGLGWARMPTLIPALIVGYVTIGCGWFILQPGMGAGVAASKRANAMQIRMLNILGHTVFGLGLYLAALLTR
ncbi:MAG: hypothetical protein FD152_1433 [Xanthobacteraceae bacterium]|nr:MAG: hypothetical protein FD152_1433 [Xanthobacteraceae bacterium]